MKLIPDDHWRWYFDAEQARLMLDLANGKVFCSHFPASMLTPDAFSAAAFCVEDAALFFTFQEKCQPLGLTTTETAELVLNALVANRFLKPLMPKSWHFRVYGALDGMPQTGDLVSVMLNERPESAYFMVVEAGDNASLCLLVQEQLVLNGKTLQRADAIKIMHDRLRFYSPHPETLSPRYAFAG
ncbi:MULTISPECIES: cell division protein ZapC [Dickeya]|uniref:Cell division protein ZapC n=1 Tax=Dickeya aquatica TaxID=1401087 RepID=A0A375AC50_9GAMM|nr:MULTISPECIES: cell division protein ZapC [Dickeya]SLM63630.1 Z-ring-associated protein. FtsZ stabilizer [Dickeya aquatica]